MKTAMILAAGRGERLKPLTNYIPKAMCVIQGIPLIEHHLNRLSTSGFERVIINHAYLGYQIRRHVGDGRQWGMEIIYSPEPPGGLETGGGIVKALPFLGTSPFITVNADIMTDYPLHALTLPKQSMAHLVLTQNNVQQGAGDFGLNQNHQLMNTDRNYTFLGIACYHPQAFEGCHLGRYSVVPLLRQLTQNGLVSGDVFDGLWIDIGSAARLNQARQCF